MLHSRNLWTFCGVLNIKKIWGKLGCWPCLFSNSCLESSASFLEQVSEVERWPMSSVNEILRKTYKKIELDGSSSVFFCDLWIIISPVMEGISTSVSKQINSGKIDERITPQRPEAVGMRWVVGGGLKAVLLFFSRKRASSEVQRGEPVSICLINYALVRQGGGGRNALLRLGNVETKNNNQGGKR